MTNSTFMFAFEGETFDQGEIDVRDLAPALLSLGEVIQAANRALNGGRAQASLRMKATNLGSFEALLNVDISFLTAIGDMLDLMTDNPDRVVAADQLLDLLIKAGKVVGGTVIGLTGLFGALKLLKGGKPDEVKHQSDGTVVIAKAGSSVVIDQRTMILLNDLPTRNAVEEFGSKALNVRGVTSVRLGDATDGAPLLLQKVDLVALKVPGPEVEEPIIEKAEREVLLKIITSAFRDGYKWRFSDGGEKPFTAEMEDLAFINSVAEGKIFLSANDTLRCLIREEQILGPAGLSKETAIVKVVEHLPGPTQLKLI